MHMLTDNGTQFIRKVFESLYAMLRTKLLTGTSYPPQTSEQAERFNKKFFVRVRRYVTDHQRDWKGYVLPMMHGCIAIDYSAMSLPIFSPVLSRQSPGSTTFDRSTPLPTDTTNTTSPYVLQARLIHRVATKRLGVDKQIKSSQRRYNNDHDRKTRTAILSLTLDSTSTLTDHEWLHLALCI